MDTTLKTCFKCGESKPRCEYYRHSHMEDGLLGKCKECTRADVRARYYAKHQEVREYDRQRAMLPHRAAQRKEYTQTPHGKQVLAAAKKRYNERYPEKYAAKIAAGNAIRDGRLVRQPCEKCGNPISQGHHDDYSKPLQVRWLCVKHHREHHRNLEQMKRLSNAA